MGIQNQLWEQIISAGILHSFFFFFLKRVKESLHNRMMISMFIIHVLFVFKIGRRNKFSIYSVIIIVLTRIIVWAGLLSQHTGSHFSNLTFIANEFPNICCMFMYI